MPIELTFRADRNAPASARAAVTQRLGDRLSPGLLADLRLVVTELVTNAVKYGPGRPVKLQLMVESPTAVRGVVADDGAPTTELRMADAPGEAGGFGLHLVDRLARRWGVYEGSTHVWFELADGRARG
ncbi:MAG: ATP-binding protein [Solirubrobacteraceae bacterium]